MTELATSTASTPTDSPASVGPAPRKPRTRGPKRRVLSDPAGDYCIYQIADESMNLPVGCLIRLPVPQHKDLQSALKWVRDEGAQALLGKQLMIFQAKEILSVEVESKPQVSIKLKPRVSTADPAKDD